MDKLREAMSFIRNIKLNFKQYFVILYQEEIVDNFVDNDVTIKMAPQIDNKTANILLRKFSYVWSMQLVK